MGTEKLSQNELQEPFPQGLKPASFAGLSGTAEAVPFPKPSAKQPLSPGN
jgi:hypothetical protein